MPISDGIYSYNDGIFVNTLVLLAVSKKSYCLLKYLGLRHCSSSKLMDKYIFEMYFDMLLQVPSLLLAYFPLVAHNESGLFFSILYTVIYIGIILGKTGY